MWFHLLHPTPICPVTVHMETFFIPSSFHGDLWIALHVKKKKKGLALWFCSMVGLWWFLCVSTGGQQLVFRPPPLVYLTYSISLHQMVLPPFERVDRKSFPAFGKEEEQESWKGKSFSRYLLISIRLCRWYYLLLIFKQGEHSAVLCFK